MTALQLIGPMSMSSALGHSLEVSFLSVSIETERILRPLELRAEGRRLEGTRAQVRGDLPESSGEVPSGRFLPGFGDYPLARLSP